MLEFSLREIKLSFKSCAWGISLSLYFNFVHEGTLKFNSWVYPLKLLAKVNSHAYVDLYFGITLNGSWNTFKELWCYVWLKGYVNFYVKG